MSFAVSLSLLGLVAIAAPMVASVLVALFPRLYAKWLSVLGAAVRQGYRACFRFRWQRIGPWNILTLNLGVVSARVWLRAASWSNKNRAHRTPGTPRYCSNNQHCIAIQPTKASAE